MFNGPKPKSDTHFKPLRPPTRSIIWLWRIPVATAVHLRAFLLCTLYISHHTCTTLFWYLLWDCASRKATHQNEQAISTESQTAYINITSQGFNRLCKLRISFYSHTRGCSLNNSTDGQMGGGGSCRFRNTGCRTAAIVAQLKQIGVRRGLKMCFTVGAKHRRRGASVVWQWPSQQLSHNSTGVERFDGIIKEVGHKQKKAHTKRDGPPPGLAIQRD